jgi:hypothetical protein
MKPCDGNHPGREARPGPWTADQCRLCWLALNDPAYAALWGPADGTPTAAPGLMRSLPCLYLGEVIDQLGCPCPGKWVRACALHRVCTLEGCKACPDYEVA